MERLHSPAAHDSMAETAPGALSQLLARVNSPGAERKDVDALLAGLALPLAADEPPRSRADLLLTLLNSRRLLSMKGSGGATVRDVAVRAMMELGHPYALEIPPTALERPRASDASSGTGQRSIPAVGIFLALLGSVPAILEVPTSLLFAIPALTTLIGGATENRGVQKAGLVLMGLQSLGAFVLGARIMLDTSPHTSGDYHGLAPILAMIAVAVGSCIALSAFLLRHPGWRIEDTP